MKMKIFQTTSLILSLITVIFFAGFIKVIIENKQLKLENVELKAQRDTLFHILRDSYCKLDTIHIRLLKVKDKMDILKKSKNKIKYIQMPTPKVDTLHLKIYDKLFDSIKYLLKYETTVKL